MARPAAPILLGFVASAEMEALATLQKYMASGKSMQEAISFCAQGEPVCKQYLDFIATFAQKFCGGTDMPMVDCLVGFSAWSQVHVKVEHAVDVAKGACQLMN